ncbi:MAG TPA: hypothetical protein VF698_09425 [Thermoanaerobaculia bacterium]
MSALCASSAEAACVNKFLSRADGNRQVITFLTGKLTFDEAQKLATAINRREASPVEWIDDRGRALGKQVGELKIVRPMPVGCDGKTSGVVFVATFISRQPTGKMTLRIGESDVTFEEQAN